MTIGPEPITRTEWIEASLGISPTVSHGRRRRSAPPPGTSEGEANRTLHDPRVAGRGRLAEVGVDLFTGRVEPQRVVDPGVAGNPVGGAELGVVEHVVHLPAELQAAPAAASEREVLEEREVPVVDAGHAEDVARLVSVFPPGGPGEGGRVQPAPRGIGSRV